MKCKEVDSIPIIRHQIDVNDVLVSSELYEQQLFFGTREKYSGPLAYGDEITCTATLTIRGNEEPEFSLPEFKVRVPKNEQPLIVHCYAGIHRSTLVSSAALTLAYPNEFESLESAHKFVLSKRIIGWKKEDTFRLMETLVEDLRKRF